MKRINHRRAGQRGTQIAELAVILPLLVFLALLVSEGAGLVRVHQVVNNAAREGARFSALPENNGKIAKVTTAVADYACFNNVKLVGGTTSACTIATFPVICANTGSGITVNQVVKIPSASGVNIMGSEVTVTCSYRLIYFPGLSFPWIGINVPNTIPLKATATFPNLYG